MFPCTFPSLNLDSYHGTPCSAAVSAATRGSLLLPAFQNLNSRHAMTAVPGTPAGFPESNFFRGPQFRAARPRIAITLFFSCRYWLLRQQTEVTLLRRFAEGILYDAILQ